MNSYNMSEMFIVANHKGDPSIGHRTGLKRKSLFHIYKKLNNCCYSKQVGAQGPDIFPPLLAVVCCLSCSFYPCVPSLSVSVFVYNATPCCCHLMLKILLRHLVWKMTSFLSAPCIIFYVSQP